MSTAVSPRQRTAAVTSDAATADVFVIFGITGDLAKVMTFARSPVMPKMTNTSAVAASLVTAAVRWRGDTAVLIGRPNRSGSWTIVRRHASASHHPDEMIPRPFTLSV